MLKIKTHWDATREIISLLTKHRQLTIEMAKRELGDRYTGQVFGIFWTVVHPLVMIGIYIFIFAFVFKTRVGGTAAMPLDFTTYLLAGLIPWFGTQDAMNKCTVAMTTNASLVKQVVFPIEILPVKSVLASAFTQLVMMFILVAYVLIYYHKVPWTFVFLPGLFFLQLLFTTGIAYCFSIVGAYFRDMKDFVQIFCISGIYLMPVFYLPEAIPSLFRPLLYLNPFSYMVWCYQDAVYFGRFEHPYSWLVFAAMGLMSFYLGYRIFRKLKIYLGSVL